METSPHKFSGVIATAITKNLSNLHTHLDSNISRDFPSEVRTLEDLQTIPMVEPKKYLTAPSQEEGVRFVPSEFDAVKKEDLFLIPSGAEAIWNTLDAHIKQKNPKNVMTLLPLWWQIDQFYANTVRENGLPILMGRRDNTPLTLKLIELLTVDTIITTQSTAITLREELTKRKMSGVVSSWVIVSPISEPSSRLLSQSGNTFIEKHIVPGRVGAYQCEELAGEVSHFHLSEEYFFEFEEERMLVTSIAEERAPFVRYPVPMKGVFGKDCPCKAGRVIEFQYE